MQHSNLIGRLGVCALLLGLGACSGGDSTSTADIKTTQGAAQQAAMIVTSAATDGVSGAPVPKRGEVARNTPPECDTGSATTTTRTDTVDSPYTESAFEITRVEYENCVVQFGPQEDPGRNFALLDGVTEDGSPDGEAVNYALRGTAVNDVLHSQLHVEDSDSGQRFDVFSDTLIRIDSRASQSDADALFDGTRVLRFEVDGQPRVTGRFRFGDASTRFHANRDDTGLLIEGPYRVRVNRCDTGDVTVATDRRLVRDAQQDFFIDGQLTLTRSDGTATIEFNSDGSVTVTTGDGQTRTFSRAELESISRDCVPEIDMPEG